MLYNDCINFPNKVTCVTLLHKSVFDSMITPILLYGTEVWGCENIDIIDQFYLNFCKSLLDVKQTTPSVMIYGELGAMPLYLKIKSRVLSFWYRSNDKICYKLYDLFHSDWIKTYIIH